MRFFSNKRLILTWVSLIWLKLSVIPLMSFKQIKPELFFILLAFYAFRIHWKFVVPLAFFVGFLQDLITNSFFGLETASYVAGATALRFFAMRFDRDKRWIQLGGLFSFSWLTLLLYSLLTFLVRGPYPFGEWFLIRTFFISIYTTGVGFFLMPLLDEWLRPAYLGKQYELF